MKPSGTKAERNVTACESFNLDLRHVLKMSCEMLFQSIRHWAAARLGVVQEGKRRSICAGSFERHLTPAESKDPKTQGPHNSGWWVHREAQAWRRNQSGCICLQGLRGKDSLCSYPQARESRLSYQGPRPEVTPAHCWALRGCRQQPNILAFQVSEGKKATGKRGRLTERGSWRWLSPTCHLQGL